MRLPLFAFILHVYVTICASRDTQPNIVFIIADDLGWNDVGFHGSEIRTPVIDKLAHDGVILDRYYVQPICTPSRSQLMSGRYQIHTGLQHRVLLPGQPNGLPLDLPTLPQLLKQQGYATHMIGKWHLGFFKKEYTPTYRGFDSHFGYWMGMENYLTHQRCYNVSGRNACGLDLHNALDPAQEYSGQYSTHVFADKADKVITNHAEMQTEKPLFLYLPFQAVHLPLQVPASYSDPYKTLIHNEHRRIYAGMMSCLDEAVGNITSSLKRNGMWDDTVLVFSTDNGGTVFGGGNNMPLRGSKNTLWEGGVRGVGFVHGKGIQATRGQKLEELIHVSDWLPTLVTLAGGDVTNMTLDGYNAGPSIWKGLPSKRTELLHNIDPLYPPVGEILPGSPFDNRLRAALRYRQWKLVTGHQGADKHYPLPNETATYLPPVNDTIHHLYDPLQPSKNLWLFDVLSDPTEDHDLSSHEADVVMMMLGKLAQYNKTAVRCRFPDIDPNSDPSRYGGVWSPWL